jgi:uncharacterized membrane protein YhaH (DUF805 family)
MDNPYQSPLDDTLAVPLDESLREYGGIGRLAYLGYSFLVGVGTNVLAAAGAGTEAGPAILVIAVIGSIALSLYVVVQRLKNMGYSGWWSLLIFVPLANIFVGLRCLICPQGYADTKKLDTAGKVVTGIVVVLFLLFVLALVASNM